VTAVKLWFQFQAEPPEDGTLQTATAKPASTAATSRANDEVAPWSAIFERMRQALRIRHPESRYWQACQRPLPAPLLRHASSEERDEHPGDPRKMLEKTKSCRMEHIFKATEAHGF